LHDWQDFPRGDRGILEYMYKLEHTSPFEMGELIIDVQVPMDHWRQWIRNRTANVNEYSTRYSEAIDEIACTDPTAWRTQGTANRQGSDDFLPAEAGALLSQREIELHELARQVYRERLAAGVAKEQARKDLPLSNYTRARWKIDLHNVLRHFLAKRLHPHAQLEIRMYARAVASIVEAIWPRTYALFEEYDLYGVKLSRTEAAALAKLVDADRVADIDVGVRKALLAKLGIAA
jgi:thymidylate synthase (FAD)